MKKRAILTIIFTIFLAAAGFFEGNTKDYPGKKIFYINSYHKGYAWSDGELKGCEETLANTGIELNFSYLDARRNSSEEAIKQSALKIKERIEKFKPNVIISADDSAFKYVIMPSYRDSAIPVIFCGINWDISVYGGPYRNTTGMIEIALIEGLCNHLENFASGNKVGLLACDVWSERQNAEYAAKHIEGGFFCQEYIKDFASWKQKFLELQDKVNMLYLASPDGIKDWDMEEAEKFVLENVRIPVGTDASLALSPLALIGLVKDPKEQGEYVARIALRILSGENPSDIPIVANKRGILTLNLKIAEKLGVIFPPAMLRNAKVIYQ